MGEDVVPQDDPGDASGPGLRASTEPLRVSALRASVPIADSLWHNGTNCYGCPHCSCGAVPDWLNEAPLRCTGCKRPLRPWPPLASTIDSREAIETAQQAQPEGPERGGEAETPR